MRANRLAPNPSTAMSRPKAATGWDRRFRIREVMGISLSAAPPARRGLGGLSRRLAVVVLELLVAPRGAGPAPIRAFEADGQLPPARAEADRGPQPGRQLGRVRIVEQAAGAPLLAGHVDEVEVS